MLGQIKLDLDDKPGRVMKNQDTLFGFQDVYRRSVFIQMICADCEIMTKFQVLFNLVNNVP